MGDNGRRHSGNDSGKERNAQLDRIGSLFRRFAVGRVNGVGNRTLDDKLGARVGDLLAQNGKKARVKAGNAFVLGHFGKAIGQTGAPGRITHGPDADGFEGAEKNVGNEFSTGRRTNVNTRLVLPGLFLAHVLDGVDLEVFHTAKLEPALDKVTQSGGAETGRQGHDSFIGNHLFEATNQAAVVLFNRHHCSFVIHGCSMAQDGWVDGPEPKEEKPTAGSDKKAFFREIQLIFTIPITFGHRHCHHHHQLRTLTGSNWTRVFTTSTGVKAPWVTLQQMPPAAAPFK
jgi:hypothetical protein